MNLHDEKSLIHIPDEWVKVWKERTVEELMVMVERLRKHCNEHYEEEDSISTTRHTLKCMESYLDHRIENSGESLDIIL